MLPNFDLNFESTNPYKDLFGGAMTECLFCCKSFTPKTVLKDKIEVEILSDLFSTFSKYMKWESPKERQFDFGEEQFPFCSSCRNNLVRVFKLDEQIQNVISDVISTIIDSQKHVSKTKRSTVSEKMEFYRCQTIVLHHPPLLVKPAVEYSKLTGLETNKPLGDYPGQCQSTADNLLVRKMPLKNSGSHPGIRRSTGKKDVRFAALVQQQLGPTKFIYDNKHLFTLPKNNWQCSACHQSFASKFGLLLHYKTAPCFGSQQPIEIIETLPTRDETVPTPKYKKGQKPKTVFRRDGMSNKKKLKKQQNPPKEDVRLLTCTICGASFKKKGGLIRHTLRLHADETSLKTFACQICSRKFATNSLLKDHARMYRHKKKHNRCIPSSTDTRRAELGQEHIKSKQVNSPNSTTTKRGKHLKTCGKGTVSSENCVKIRDQMKSLCSSGTQEFGCQFCNQILRSKYLLKMHVAQAHVPGPDKAFQCRVCGKKCGTRPLLKAHFRNHEKVECEVCSEIYSVHSIYAHKYIKHKIMECTVCRENLSVDSIQEHIKWHKEQDPKGRKPASWVPQRKSCPSSN